MAIKLKNFIKYVERQDYFEKQRCSSTPLQQNPILYDHYLYESTCTFFTALPDGSIMFLNDASHASASAVLQATEGTEGTHDAAESDGKCSENIDL